MELPHDLRCFCDHIATKYGSPAVASEDQKADEYRKAYFSKLPLTVNTLLALASDFNIDVVSLEAGVFPKNVRGFSEVLKGRRPKIYYKRGDCESGVENTLLHEFREIIEPFFPLVCPGYDPLKTNAVHIAANKFASAVLLPQGTFRKQVYRTGLDTMEMANLYSKSCAQVLLRIGEVLQGEIFFYGALYENGSDGNPDWQVTYWTRSLNEEVPEANARVPGHFFPRKGHLVIPNSLIELAILSGRPHLIEHISLTEDIDEDGLVAIAHPLVRSGKVTKVALVVLHERDRRKLRPQIGKINPVIIEHFHKHL